MVCGCAGGQGRRLKPLCRRKSAQIYNRADFS
jgi:hypothetical protein